MALENLSPLCQILSQDHYTDELDDQAVHVEVARHPFSMAENAVIERAVFNYLQNVVRETHVPVVWTDFSSKETESLKDLVLRIRVSRCEECHTTLEQVHFTGVENAKAIQIHVYHEMNEEVFVEEITCGEENHGGATSHLALPSRQLDGLWDSLVYEDDVKSQLLNYAISALQFADRQVDPDIISWNRVILLHGPPGTGKTSLSRALAQKLAIRLSHRFPSTQLIEVNSHSLFSRWFSESGKLVMKMFAKIQEYVEQRDRLVFVLIDEVESLTAMRQMALSSGEPSDSIRVVNALLTQLDQLKRHPNVLILTTSNITGAIDVAFVDRADLRLYIGPPTVSAIYHIYRTCVQELTRVGIINSTDQLLTYRTLEAMCSSNTNSNTERKGVMYPALHCSLLQPSLLLREVATKSCGLSGRVLRKVAFLTHANCLSGRDGVSISEYLTAMLRTVAKIGRENEKLSEVPVSPLKDRKRQKLADGGK